MGWFSEVLLGQEFGWNSVGFEDAQERKVYSGSNGVLSFCMEDLGHL